MVDKEPEKIERIFEAINRLNVHRDRSYKFIAFSDTILIYNLFETEAVEDQTEAVMFLCEFASDLLMWGIKLDFSFRAILLKGDFHYTKKENLEAYYGNALVKAYHMEKTLPAMGLFIAKDIAHLNEFYRMVPFNENFDFVFVTQGLRDLNVFAPGPLPVDFTLLEGPSTTYLAIEVSMLKKLKQGVDTQEEPKVREKYIRTYDLYKSHYQWIIEPLEKADFDHTIICKSADWNDNEGDWWTLDE